MAANGHGHLSPRDRTREDVYRLIRTHPNTTRSSLVALTGLSASTVGHAVSRLLREGRVAEHGAEGKGPGSGSGRPATILTAVATGAAVAAIDFGHSHIRVALADALDHILDEDQMTLDVDFRAAEAMDAATERLTALLRGHDIEEPASIVAGIPGPVDRHTGLVRSPTILSSWVGLEPSTELERRLGSRVHLENDAVLGAYGERVQGAGRHHTDYLYVKVSHGIGAGLIIGGEPYRGGTGLAGEIGHIRLAGRTELCRCGGRGCLETAVTLPSIAHQIAHTHPGRSLTDLDLSTADDAVTRRILADAGRVLGGVLADICNLLNPTAIIVGGTLSAQWPPLITEIEASVRRFAQPGTEAAVEIVPAELGDRAELVGALHMASQLALA